jgi:hypothetical protein
MRGIASARGLTAHDLAGQPWLIVAVRPDGDRYVVEEARTREQADGRAVLLGKHLDGVTVRVEEIGKGE